MMAGKRAKSAPRKNPALSLAETQALFQKALLDGDTRVLDLLCDTSRTKRTTLFGVYENAYAGRLAEIVANDYEYLAVYMGDDAFDALAREYVVAHPSRFQNARWFGRGIPEFLRAHEVYASRPELAGLALLEKTLADAFDAPDAQPIAMASLAAHAPDDWGRLTFAPHPSAVLLSLATDALSLWTSIKDGATTPATSGPAASRAETPHHVIVWRRDVTPMVRAMGAEEAMMWREACRGARFDALCEMAAAYDRPDEAAMRVATYLQGWLMSELLISATLTAEKAHASA